MDESNGVRAKAQPRPESTKERSPYLDLAIICYELENVRARLSFPMEVHTRRAPYPQKTQWSYLSCCARDCIEPADKVAIRSALRASVNVASIFVDLDDALADLQSFEGGTKNEQLLLAELQDAIKACLRFGRLDEDPIERALHRKNLPAVKRQKFVIRLCRQFVQAMSIHTGPRLSEAIHRMIEYVHSVDDNGHLKATHKEDDGSDERPGSSRDNARSDFAYPLRKQIPRKSWKQIASLWATECPGDAGVDEATMRVAFNRSGGMEWYDRRNNS